MAAKDHTNDMLEREITCALCLGIIQDPKKLLCHHVFCRTCLESLFSRNVTAAVSCPECRRVTQLSAGGVKDLPTDLYLEYLANIHRRRFTSGIRLSRRSGTEVTHSTLVGTSKPPGSSTYMYDASRTKPAVRQVPDENWDIVGHYDIRYVRSGPASSDTGHRVQRGPLERPSRIEQGSATRSTTFSDFFSQLKTEWNVLVEGVKQLGLGSRQKSAPKHSPSLHQPRPATTGQTAPKQCVQSTRPTLQGSVPSATSDNGAVTNLLRARNQEIGQLHQQLQVKHQEELQHKQNVERLKRQEMEQNRRFSMMDEQIKKEQSKSKQMEREMDGLKRQLQDQSKRQLCGQVTVQQVSLLQATGTSQQVIELPNTLNYRLIARHPDVSCKLIESAKSHGADVQFLETDSYLQVVISGTSEALNNVQTNLSILDHKLQEMLKTKYMSVHCAFLPLLSEPSFSKALAEIELKNYIEIGIADNSGTVASIKEFIQLLQSECYAGRLLTTDELKNICIPDVPINSDYEWQLQSEGGVITLPGPVNQYLNQAFFTERKEKAEFEFNNLHYSVNFSLMQIKENETGHLMSLKFEPSWSYAISDSDFVAHEAQDSVSLENLFRFGGSFVMLAGSKHSVDVTAMHQIDLESGVRVAVKRSPTPEHQQVPKYFVTIPIRGLPNSLQPAIGAINRALKSFCATVNFTNELLPTVPQDWKEIIFIQMLNTARHYCINIEHYALDGDKISIRMLGSKDVLDKVQVLLKEQSLEHQHRSISQQKPLSNPPQQKYPPEWEQQKDDIQLFNVRSASSEWKSVEGLMKRSLETVQIVRVQRIQNRQLWDKYALEMKHMEERNSGSVGEMKLFHGTRDTDPRVIITSVRGIDFRYSRRDYKLRWGTGAYFAVNASYSHHYSYIDENTRKRHLLLVKVLTGKSCSYGNMTDHSLTKPPPLSQGSPVLYDTVNGYSNGSLVYVVYDHDRAYPAYLITYS